MLDRIDLLEQRVRELQAKVTELVDSVREMAEAKAMTLVATPEDSSATSRARAEDEARGSPPDSRRK